MEASEALLMRVIFLITHDISWAVSKFRGCGQ